MSYDRASYNANARRVDEPARNQPDERHLQDRDPSVDAERSGDGAHTLTSDRQAVVGREKERYGGIKWGSAFFGWLTATGTAVILTAVLAAAGAAIGVATNTDPAEAASKAGQQSSTVGIVSGIALLVILLLAYYCGGYVAGRMARFNGMKQGIAVWVWAIVIAVLVAVAGAVLGSKYDILSNLNGFPRIPVDEGSLTTGGIVALIAAVVVALIGAILGGLAGMRFHRNVDKTGLGH
jgi:hypothetical protein